MGLLREYIRNLLAEQEEELSELDKIKEIFVSNGAQAVELGGMLLPDSREVGMMKRTVRLVREFLALFEEPMGDPTQASSYDKRLAARKTFYYDMNQTLRSIITNHRLGAQSTRPGKVTNMYQKLGRIYLRIDMIILGKELEDHLPDIEAAAEWAGVPAPQIPEQL